MCRGTYEQNVTHNIISKDIFQLVSSFRVSVWFIPIVLNTLSGLKAALIKTFTIKMY